MISRLDHTRRDFLRASVGGLATVMAGGREGVMHGP
jgi:hypothetical protein